MTPQDDQPVSRKCVLVVDDTLLVRRFVGGLFTKAGHWVIEAEDGEEAIAAAMEHGPDLIVMDVTMPNMNGIEALQALRKNEQFHDTPIVMLTGEHDRETVTQILAAGISEYIVKENLTEVSKRLGKYLAMLAETS